MNRRAVLKAGLIGASGFLTCGLTMQDRPEGWAGHIESDDPTWTILNGATLAVDAKRGLLTAEFHESVRKFSGRTFTISGFMLPLDASASFAHFVITRRNASCPFCPPNEPTEAVEIFAEQPVRFSPDEIEATGTLQLLPEASGGLFYQLTHAKWRRT